MVERGHRNHVQWLLGLSVVSATLVLGVTALNRAGLVGGGFKIPIALVPLVPLFWFFKVLVRWVDSMDELQRRIHLEAMALQFAATALLVMGYGLLAKFGALPDLSFSTAYPWLWMAMFVFWVAGIAVVGRKYE